MQPHGKVDPEGLYSLATPPPYMPISVAQAEGPYFILVMFLVLLCGANCALYAVYIRLFGGRKRDPYILQISVLFSVICNIVLAVYGAWEYYRCSLIDLYSYPGFNMNKIEWYVPMYHTLQALPDSIGQMYFAIRIAKLFDHRNVSTRLGLAVAMMGISTQFVLMNWFGAAFYTIRYKSHLLDPAKRHWVKSILAAWAIIFITLEICMTITTMARLYILRKQTSMDAARRVLFNLALYSLQGQTVLSVFSLTSLWLFSRSATGWYTPMYLLSGALYTLVLLANLLYRQVVGERMKQAQSDYHPSGSGSRGLGRDFNLNAVRTYTEYNIEPIGLQETRSTERIIAPQGVIDLKAEEEAWRNNGDAILTPLSPPTDLETERRTTIPNHPLNGPTPTSAPSKSPSASPPPSSRQTASLPQRFIHSDPGPYTTPSSATPTPRPTPLVQVTTTRTSIPIHP